MRVVHLTSVHSHHDIRIYQKMCRSLARHGYEVHLVAPWDGRGSIQGADGVHMHSVAKPTTRRERFRKTREEVYQKGLALQGDFYHIHDPELLPVGRRLKRHAHALVIYDSHEDARAALRDKPWLMRGSRRAVSRVYGLYEDWSVAQLSGVISATPAIGRRFARHPGHATIKNYVLAGEFAPHDDVWNMAEPRCLYAGVMTRERGIHEMIDAIALCGDRSQLLLAGRWDSAEIQRQAQGREGWKQVQCCGELPRDRLAQMMRAAHIGLLLFHPLANHINAQPNKLFEYMAAGLPVIVSHFPLWVDLVTKAQCGIAVDPRSPTEIAQAIRTLSHDPELAREMGRNGRKAVETIYNWSIEEKKLVAYYGKMLREGVTCREVA